MSDSAERPFVVEMLGYPTRLLETLTTLPCRAKLEVRNGAEGPGCGYRTNPYAVIADNPVRVEIHNLDQLEVDKLLSLAVIGVDFRLREDPV